MSDDDLSSGQGAAATGPSSAQGAKPTGPDPALAALARARAAARERDHQKAPTRSTTRSGSKPGSPTGRDPVLLGTALDAVAADHGWQQPTAVAAMTSRWAEIVGADVAEHVSVDEFVVDSGELRLRADSTAWATQMRLLVPTLMTRLGEEVGAGVVRSVRIDGPAAPSWSKGPRSVPGRGPRDTYG